MIPGLSTLPMMNAGAGVIPDAISFGDINGEFSGSTGGQGVTGLWSSIQIRAEISSVTLRRGSASLYASVNGDIVGDVGIANSATLDITVPPGSMLEYGADATPSSAIGSAAATVTLKYKSEGSSTFDQTWDSFDVNLEWGV